jgi:hypothetical protein
MLSLVLSAELSGYAYLIPSAIIFSPLSASGSHLEQITEIHASLMLAIFI